jgi:hypothetical protein
MYDTQRLPGDISIEQRGNELQRQGVLIEQDMFWGTGALAT